MGRRYGLTSLVLGLGVVAASMGWAGVPDPSLSTVPNVLCVPGGSMAYTMTILGTSGPIDSANVTLQWSAAGEAAACWCTSQVHPNVTATTNASGVATFHIAAGGCLNPATISGGLAVQVFVNSIHLKDIGQVSPDIVNNTSPPCTVSLSDAVAFTPPLSTNTYGFCFDMNSDGTVGLVDAVAITPPLSLSLSCP